MEKKTARTKTSAKESKLVDKVKQLLEKRAMIKKKKPKFIRSDANKLARLKKVWRKPTGRHNKVRTRNQGFLPHPSYSSPKAVRYLHPSGKKEVLIHNEKDLEKIRNDKEVARIAGSVGLRKRLAILKAAEKLKVKLLNIGKKADDYLKKEREAKEKEEKKKEEKK